MTFSRRSRSSCRRSVASWRPAPTRKPSLSLQALRPGSTEAASNAPLSLLVPSFMLSEISRAFEIGFLIYLPFLIIDLVTAAILMSMGMMMVPPAVVSLPFKLAFFVVADGWTLISGRPGPQLLLNCGDPSVHHETRHAARLPR